MANNTQPILRYKQFRKINSDATALNLSDKNFTIISTIAATSDIDWTDSENSFKCNELVDPSDLHYNNLDMNEWDIDGTNLLYPIFSFGNQIKYDQTSLSNGEYYDCHTAFLYRNEIHWLINDSTSNPPLMHMKMPIPSHTVRQKSQNHLIFTRNDNMFLMHLYCDKQSVLGSFRLENNSAVSGSSIFLDATAVSCEWGTTVDNWYVISSNTLVETYVDPSCHYASPYYVRHYTYTIPSNGNYYFYVKNGYDTSIQSMGLLVYKDTVSTSSLGTYLGGSGSLYSNQETTIGPFYLTSGTVMGLKAYVRDTLYNADPDGHYFIKLWREGEIVENIYNWHEDGELKYTTNYKISDTNINLNDIHDSNPLNIGYVERYPNSPSDGTILYKNSFKGLMSEFCIFEDQSYWRKYNNFVHNYSCEYNNESEHIYNYNDIVQKIINPNQIPWKDSYATNSYESALFKSGLPSSTEITVSKINTLRLATKSDVEVDTTGDSTRDDKICMIEFDNIQTDSTNQNINFDKNDITYTPSKTFCVFTFETIEKYNDTTSEIDLEKYVISKNDWSLISYDSTKSYEDWLSDDTTLNYFSVYDFTDSTSTQNIINSLNTKLNTINGTGKLITKFYVKLFRDERYIIYYDVNIERYYNLSDDYNKLNMKVNNIYLSTSEYYDLGKNRYAHYNITGSSKYLNNFIFVSLGDDIEEDSTIFLENDAYFKFNNGLTTGYNTENYYDNTTHDGWILTPRYVIDDKVPFNNKDLIEINDSTRTTEPVFDQIKFDTIEFQDSTGTVLASIDGTDVRNGLYGENLVEELISQVESSYPSYDELYDISKLHFIVGSIGDKDFIIDKFNSFKKNMKFVNVDTTITKTDSTTYQIIYDNSKVSKYSNIILKFSNDSTSSLEWSLNKTIEKESFQGDWFSISPYIDPYIKYYNKNYNNIYLMDSKSNVYIPETSTYTVQRNTFYYYYDRINDNLTFTPVYNFTLTSDYNNITIENLWIKFEIKEGFGGYTINN